MANPGVGPKFLSVNLNKSYGQSGHSSSSNGSYGSGRGRTGGYTAGGGGMVVLSRPRSSHKTGPKVFVPPPVNLPSLRKEHERFDPLGSGSGSAGGAGSGNGSRPASSAPGWSKPNVVTVADGEGAVNAFPPATEDWDHGRQSADGSTKSSSVYASLAARPGATGSNHSAPVQPQRTTVLRGEDFPSLRATISSAITQKSSVHQNQKHGMIEESSGAQRDGSHSSSGADMRSNRQSTQLSAADANSSNTGGYFVPGAARPSEQARKQDDYFPGPLPLVRLSPRSDWADDERDTSHGFSERNRDYRLSKAEQYWEGDFDFPRTSILPHKPSQSAVNRWTRHEDETSKTLPTEPPSLGPSSRDIRPASREGSKGDSWRASSRDGLVSQESSERSLPAARSNNVNYETVKENKHLPSQFGGPIKDDHNHGSAASRENTFGRRDVAYGQGGKQQWNKSAESFSGRGAERSTFERNVSVPESNRHRVDSFQSSFAPKTFLSTASKGIGGGSSLNSAKEKRSFSRSEKPYAEDWGNANFDDFDPFSGNLLEIVKRKKDASRKVDFHDPVRESFEAELERVQQQQEQERQRVIEEQERALEMVRKEEEERQRITREQEENHRRMEEEAREAAWRAEQERLEAARRAEEQRIAREDEKRRMMMEEERRKQAAKQKLQELEEKIARKQAVATNAHGSASVADQRVSEVPRGDASRADEFSGWEDSERMVERITSSVPSDSSGWNRSYDVGSRAHHLKDGPFALPERGKSNSWRRDVNENSSSLYSSEQGNIHHSPRRDAFAGGRGFSRYGGNGYVTSGPYCRGGFPEPQLNDPYGRNSEFDSGFNGVAADRFDEMGWNQGRSHGNLHAPFGDQNSELDELYSYGRPKYSSRQPRVLPPPSLSSMHRTTCRSDSEQTGPTAFIESITRYDHASGSGRSASLSIYDENQREMQENSDILDIHEGKAKTEVQNPHTNVAPRCDSQSSLSVSSPPHSPAHLSHDDLDDTGNSPVACAPVESNEIPYSGNESVLLGAKTGKERVMAASSDDDDEWDSGNKDLQVQEEYDEEDDVYGEEDEVHEQDNEAVDMAQEFEGIHLEEKGPSVVENVVLGFDQGVQVGIPSDENEGGLCNEETTLTVQQSPVDSAELSESLIEQEDASSTQLGDACKIDNYSSGTFQDAQNTIQDLVAQPTYDPHTSALPGQLNSGNLSLGSVVSASQSAHSSANMNSYSSPALSSSAISSHNQAEAPVKFQFGLFSGPSLVSPPVSAIQIGSIQMPLPLHHQLGPSLSHIHPPQPTLFQFGQIRYPSPISQGLLPLTPQSMTFSQPNVPANYPLNKKPGVPLSSQSTQVVSAHNLAGDGTFLLRRDSQQQEASAARMNQGTEKNADLPRQSPGQESSGMNQPGLESSIQARREGSQYNAVVNSSISNGQTSKVQMHSETNLSRAVLYGQPPGGRGRKVPVTSRSRNQRQKLPFSAGDTSRFDGNGFQRRPRRDVQRMEFRVKKSADRRQSSGTDAVDQSITDVRFSNNRRGSKHFTRSGLRNEALPSKTMQTADYGNICADKGVTQEKYFETKTDKGHGKEATSHMADASHPTEGSLKRNIRSEEDVDAPLQSGIVRIFNQPGIEAPSDEDDFIEVRSKRQMLNDRREQREKEKAKSNNKKEMRKPHSTSQGTPSARTATKASVSLNGEPSNTTRAEATQKRGLVNEVAKGSGMVSQPLAPIGTPPVNAPATANSQFQIDKTPKASSLSAPSSGQLGLDLDLNSKKKLLDGTKASLSSWDGAPSNQEVMPLTQTQFDEAMKPGQFDMHSSSSGDHIKPISELSRSTSPVNLKDTPFPPVTSPINSLLAGEKIQFGAVTSPTVLPPSSRAIPHVIRSDGSQSDLQISRSIAATKNECSLFEKGKPSDGSRINSDREAEAEAAASAIVDAAISNDEAVGNALGSGPNSVSDTKGLKGADLDRLAVSSKFPHSDAHGNQPTGVSKSEEVLNVSLPADLSVETPPMSLWPPLPSPHGSSSHMVPPFHGAAPSHFPLYDMNPMLGGRIFAYGPHDESAASQPQPQKSCAPGLSSPGTWQPCHSGVDSFYGPPAGFTGPFINPPGSIPAGVPGSPHMVVYNHFAPVGRFGQVGLSYMGTYISSTKQPDWKHNPASTSAGADGDMKNLDLGSAQLNLPGVPQGQHLAPGSPLLPMAPSPVAMFDVSPFQPSAELPPQARWSHLPGAPSLHPIPPPVPASQHSDIPAPPQHSQGTSDGRSFTAPRFSKPQAQTQPANMASAVKDTTASPPKAEKPELAAPRSSNGPEPSPANGSSVENPEPNKVNKPVTSSEEHKSSGQQRYNYHRGGGGGFQRNGSRAEWSNRRTGFHGRSSLGGGGRGFPQAKMKQIYVAKQSSGGPSTNA